MPDLDLSPPPAQIFKGDLGSGGWSDADKIRQALALGLLGADWAQTRTIAKDPYNGGKFAGGDPWHEVNPILGPHPSTGKVNNYFASAAIGHTLLMNALPPDLRKYAQYGTIGLEGGQVRRNKINFGIGMTF